MALLALNLKPEPKQLRTFGAIGFGAFGLLAASALFRQSVIGIGMDADVAQLTGYVLGGLAAACAFFSVVFPKALLPLFVGMSVVTFPIGFVLSHVIMLVMYFGIITPIGVVMRLGGWDPLTRKIDKSADSYWVKRPPAPGARALLPTVLTGLGRRGTRMPSQEMA